jgi:hypothetical protein
VKQAVPAVDRDRDAEDLDRADLRESRESCLGRKEDREPVADPPTPKTSAAI